MPRHLGLFLLPALTSLPLLGCAEVQIDTAEYCILNATAGLTMRVWIPARGGDIGAELSCEIIKEGDREFRLTSEYVVGRDPNDAAQGPLIASCDYVPIEDGEITLTYGSTTGTVTIPSEPQPWCADVMVQD